MTGQCKMWKLLAAIASFGGFAAAWYFFETYRKFTVAIQTPLKSSEVSAQPQVISFEESTSKDSISADTSQVLPNGIATRTPIMREFLSHYQFDLYAVGDKVELGIMDTRMDKAKACASWHWPRGNVVSLNYCTDSSCKNVEGMRVYMVPRSCCCKIQQNPKQICVYDHGPTEIVKKQTIPPCFADGRDRGYWTNCVSKSATKYFVEVGPLWHEAVLWFPVYGVKTTSMDVGNEQVKFAWISHNITQLASSGGEFPSVKGSTYRVGAVMQGPYFDKGTGKLIVRQARQPDANNISQNLFDHVHEHVGCLKMDCDGCEGLALRSAVCVVCKYGIDNLFSEYYPSSHPRRGGPDPLQYLADLALLGFDCFVTENFRRKPQLVKWGDRSVLHNAKELTQLVQCGDCNGARKALKRIDIYCHRVKEPASEMCLNYGCT